MNCFELFCGEWRSNGNAGTATKGSATEDKRQNRGEAELCHVGQRKKVGEARIWLVTFATGGARTGAGQALKGSPER